MENRKTISTTFYASRESSVSFWFCENFPKIAVYVIGGSGTETEDSILDIRLRVFVNGSEQLVYLCNYMLRGQKMAKHMIWCGLRCKHNRVISTHKWNHVQVSWELKYHRPYDPHRVISDDSGIPTIEIDLSGIHVIHVYEEENSSIGNIRFTNPDISPSQVETMRNDYIIYFEGTSYYWDIKLLKLMKAANSAPLLSFGELQQILGFENSGLLFNVADKLDRSCGGTRLLWLVGGGAGGIEVTGEKIHMSEKESWDATYHSDDSDVLSAAVEIIGDATAEEQREGMSSHQSSDQKERCYRVTRFGLPAGLLEWRLRLIKESLENSVENSF